MSSVIRLTSKRQATFPAALCRELGLKPGDKLVIKRQEDAGRVAWVLQAPSVVSMPWFGCLRSYAKGKPHDMDAIRENVAKKRGDVL